MSLRDGRNSDVTAGAHGATAHPDASIGIGKRTLVEELFVQRRTREPGLSPTTEVVQAAAAHGTRGGGGQLPHLDTIQRLFGRQDISHVQAHTDDAAREGATAMDAHGFASSDHVAFAGAPDLHTTAHEAAHVVQQRGGVQLKGWVGEAGDQHERHADQVADAVIRGESSEGLLDRYSGGEAEVQRQAVQRKPDASNPNAGIPAAQADPAAHLIRLLTSTASVAGGDPAAAHLNTLDTPALLVALGDAVDRGYAPQLHARLAAARPLLAAALYAAELARIALVTPNHSLLQRAGVALDQISRDQQLQIFSYLLHRRGVSVEAVTLMEGVLAMRAGADQDSAAASREPLSTGAGRGAADPAGAPAGDEQAAGAAVGASVAGGAAGPAPINPGPWAPPGNQPGGLYVGTAAHNAITVVYREAHPGELIFSNSKPISTILDTLTQLAAASPNPAALTQEERASRPDIANAARHHVYEIKPAAAQAEAAAKARTYVATFTKAGIPMVLGPMGEPGTTGRLPAPAGVFMFQSPEPGVITYEYRRGRLVPVPVPQLEPATERQWRWELQPLTPMQKQAIVTTTVGGAMLLMIMILLAPVGA